jgi:hypothetical protein
MADTFIRFYVMEGTGFSFHGAKVRKKIDTRKREGIFFGVGVGIGIGCFFFRHWRWHWHWLFLF